MGLQVTAMILFKNINGSMGIWPHHRPTRAQCWCTAVPEWVARARSSPSSSCGTTTMAPRLRRMFLFRTNYRNFDRSLFWPKYAIYPNVAISNIIPDFDQTTLRSRHLHCYQLCWRFDPSAAWWFRRASSTSTLPSASVAWWVQAHSYVIFPFSLDVEVL